MWGVCDGYTDATTELPLGVEVDDCLRSLDWNPLDPAGLEVKYYAPGQGLVAEEGLHSGAELALYGTFTLDPSALPDYASATFTTSTIVDHPYHPLPVGATWEYEADTEDGLELVSAEVLAMTRVVAGTTCVVVHVEEFLDGTIQEATDDWFAQDDAGNVWYMGESVVNYEYDELGNLTGTNTEGSWEAGMDIAGTGSNAAPGYAMPAVTTPGASYYQEFYEEEAEDVGRILESGITVNVGGTDYMNCIRTIDWNPLEGDGLEYKLYAPGTGLIRERDLVGGEETDLTATSL